MLKADFARRDLILCNFSIVDPGFLPRDSVEKLRKTWYLLAKSGSAIQFLLKFCFRNHDQNIKIVKGLRYQISVLAKFASNPEARSKQCAIYGCNDTYLL